MLPNNAKSQLNKNGFIHLHGIFSERELDSLNQTLSLAFPSENNCRGIEEHNRLLSHYPELRSTPLFQKVQTLATELCSKKTYYSFDHAIFKASNAEELKWHQDQIYKLTVRQMQSLHFWIPLHDVPTESGPIEYIPHSHRQGINKHYKEKNSDYAALNLPQGLVDTAKTCSCKKGDVLVHHPLTIHRSLPNTSDSIRKAWILHFSPYGQFDRFLPTNVIFYLKNRLFGHSSIDDSD